MVSEELAFLELGFTHPDQFWTLTRREFSLVMRGHFIRERRQLEHTANFVRTIIGNIPMRGAKAKVPSISDMIGFSPEEKAELLRRRKKVRAQTEEGQ